MRNRGLSVSGCRQGAVFLVVIVFSGAHLVPLNIFALHLDIAKVPPSGCSAARLGLQIVLLVWLSALATGKQHFCVVGI